MCGGVAFLMQTIADHSDYHHFLVAKKLKVSLTGWTVGALILCRNFIIHLLLAYEPYINGLTKPCKGFIKTLVTTHELCLNCDFSITFLKFQ